MKKNYFSCISQFGKIESSLDLSKKITNWTYRKIKFVGINWLLQRPGILVFPDRLQNIFGDVLQLVRHPPWPVFRGSKWWLDHTVDRLHARLVSRWRLLYLSPCQRLTSSSCCSNWSFWRSCWCCIVWTLK